MRAQKRARSIVWYRFLDAIDPHPFHAPVSLVTKPRYAPSVQDRHAFTSIFGCTQNGQRGVSPTPITHDGITHHNPQPSSPSRYAHPEIAHTAHPEHEHYTTWTAPRTRWIASWVTFSTSYTRKEKQIINDLNPCNYSYFHMLSSLFFFSFLVFSFRRDIDAHMKSKEKRKRELFGR